MSKTIPSTMQALIVQEGKTVSVQNIPIPTLDDNDILVKVEAIAQNPTDWKHVEYDSLPGAGIGCDFSGTIVQLGKATIGHVAVGDHVAGFVHGGQWKYRGAFAEYLKTDSDLVWVVPKGTLSHEEAATMGCGLWTAVQALYHPTRLGLVEPPAIVSIGSKEWVFIYGGSTSVGQYAIQLAHLSGYKVATVASPHNHSLVKSLGADVVFDYKSSTVVQDLKKATNNTLHHSLDTHSADGSEVVSVRVLGPGPGKVVVILAVDEDAKVLREDVHVQSTLIYTALGFPFTRRGTHFPASSSDRAHMASFLTKIPSLVETGADGIRANTVKLWEGGLGGVKEGLKYMKQGNVSGVKIVYKV